MGTQKDFWRRRLLTEIAGPPRYTTSFRLNIATWDTLDKICELHGWWRRNYNCTLGNRIGGTKEKEKETQRRAGSHVNIVQTPNVMNHQIQKQLLSKTLSSPCHRVNTTYDTTLLQNIFCFVDFGSYKRWTSFIRVIDDHDLSMRFLKFLRRHCSSLANTCKSQVDARIEHTLNRESVLLLADPSCFEIHLYRSFSKQFHHSA